MGILERRAARALAAVLAAAGLVLLAPSTAGAAEKVLSLTVYKQEESNWCWAAASKMIIKYQTGKVVTQCNIVKNGKAASVCKNVAGTKANVRRALDRYGVNAGTEVPTEWARNVSEIKAGRPVYGTIRWREGGGHALVIRGWYDTGYSYGVSYADPWTGTTTSKEWGQYLSNSRWTAGTQLIHLYKK